MDDLKSRPHLHDALPSRKPLIQVLLVGSHGVGKRALAKAMGSLSSRSCVALEQLKVAVHLTSELGTDEPGMGGERGLSETEDSHVEIEPRRADYIVFVVSMASRASLECFRASMGSFPRSYLLGRAMVALTRSANKSTHAFELVEVTQLADTYRIPLYHINTSEEGGVAFAAKLVLQNAAVACRAASAGGVSPLLPSALELEFRHNTLLG